jgi:hypothetical protein
VYAAFFLICTSTFLKIRWWVGTLVLATPVALLHAWQRGRHMHVSLPPDALIHVSVAWAAGGLMAYLAEWYRRQMFSSQREAAAAHAKELQEAQARVAAQRQLAAAQAQAAQRALVVAREKAAHEAQIEFMSLMCHEVCVCEGLRAKSTRCVCLHDVRNVALFVSVVLSLCCSRSIATKPVVKERRVSEAVRSVLDIFRDVADEARGLKTSFTNAH